MLDDEERRRASGGPLSTPKLRGGWQARAMGQAGKVANQFRFSKGKPRVDKKFKECARAWILPWVLVSSYFSAPTC